MNWSRGLMAALFAVPLIALLAFGFGHDPHAVPSVLQGRTAPDFVLQDLQGASVSLQQFKGQPVVINFWSTWCVPCQTEHPLLREAAKHYAGKVSFLGIIYQDDPERVRQKLQTQALGYPQLLDPGSQTAIDYGVAGVPESFIVDAKGQIVHKQSGIFTATELAQRLDRVLQPTASHP